MTEFAHDNSELGAVINGFSLSESGQLATALEKTGQAIDATYISTTRLVSLHTTSPPSPPRLTSRTLPQLQDLEQSWTEPLHEYTQFSEIIKKLLQYRHQKHVQYEATIDGIESKKDQLEELERQEAEARRLESALAAAGVPVSRGTGTRGGVSRSNSQQQQRARSSSTPVSPVDGPAAPLSASSDPSEDEDADEMAAARRIPQSQSVPEPLPPAPVSSTSMRKSKAAGSGLLSALSHSIQGMMDVDPESARRSNISKTRDAISQVRLFLPALLSFVFLHFLGHTADVGFVRSSKTPNTSQPKTSNTPPQRSKPTSIVSNAKKWPMYGR